MKSLKKVWHYVRWPLLILFLAYAALVIYRIPAVGEEQKTADAIAYIQAQKINLSDVEAANLPPVPYQPENDATVAGIDKNNNDIRDDVELAIYNKYPKDAKIRAAELQYALALQLMITQVFNSDTWKAAAQQDSRGFACVGQTVPNKDLNALDKKIKEVETLVLNTQKRKDAQDAAYEYTTSYGDLDGVTDCDIDLSTLSN